MADLSVVVLTFNEERNLPACLESVAGWVTQVMVVDSGSTDRTVEIARRFGASVFVHPFESHSR
jgi:glycosyltransferase involved in cell wall biosynthesis